MWRLLLLMSLALNALASNFGQKKILTIKPHADEFKIIDLKQKVLSPSLDQQKALFDSSTLIEKKTIKDKNIDFAIVLTFKETFGYFLEDFRISAKEFSKEFSRNFIHYFKFNLANRSANNLYQDSKALYFSPKDAKLVNVSAFLKKEEDKSKTYIKFIDYLMVVNLEEFYVNITHYGFVKTYQGMAKINVKLLSTKDAKILMAKNIKMKLALKSIHAQQNYQNILQQMPKMLNQAIEKEFSKLKIL
ncbi:hypothetical protein LNU06_07135 [Campylobacter sp. VicNov18]|uniref:hypothetical protein n=1 Tax=Campylobacter bilis TaxID=2691918 RepID=UPI00130E7F54|nr:hypothetical protein [Campylobacter bilis]MPV64217.1 hypothetical protein [Campylobacter hepaticus]MBM0637721.1 hypothetical protein [Campylobacter bilis]MCC8278446.1 hypothetical protein [Campylobacter bilis]MCC8299950.1 hypothetical protein [Campylobacter bilis]MCC8301355.1 hypothetical protein [Campylobacter bilis]